MILRVPFELFAEALRKYGGENLAFLDHQDGEVAATAALKSIGGYVESFAAAPIEEVRHTLTELGFEVREGRWSSGGEEGPESRGAHIAAVAYKSRDAMPGIWVDAYPQPPTPALVLRRMYDEFVENGEVGEITFEHFIHAANPNVLVLAPDEIARFRKMNFDAVEESLGEEPGA
ncbi:MAG: hypothetical protein M5U21_02355 [Fimbriimonadaceae bacterium]|nr:hypothetical protein [Fimbriimonadaceae bacterium]